MRQLPNLVTLLGGVLSLAGLAWLGTRPELGAGLLVLGWVCDLVDGPLARRLGVSSHFGEQLDWAIDVAVVHAALVVTGFLWAVLPFAVVQARSLVIEERQAFSLFDLESRTLQTHVVRRRISGRTTVVAGVLLVTLEEVLRW